MRVDPAAGRDDRAADVDPSRRSRCWPSLRCRRCSRRRGGRRSNAPRRNAARSHNRLARHLFDIATTAPPGKEVRVTGIGDRLVAERRDAWERGYRPIAAARWASAAWHTLAWAVFGAAYVGAIVFVSSGLRAPAGDVLLVLAAGARLSAYIGATVGEIGFLRGFWMDGSRRLAWLEDYAASLGGAGRSVPRRRACDRGIRFEHVSFAYPGTVAARARRRDRCSCPPARSSPSSAKTAPARPRSVKLLAKMYEPTSRVASLSTARRSRACAADEWRARLAGAFQDFFRFEFRARHTRGRRRRAAARRRAGGVAAVERAGAGRRGGAA